MLEIERKHRKGRSMGQRLKLLYLMDYLLENTDEDHTVRASDIEKYMLEEMDIPVERKTVQSDIHLLDEYGLEMQYDTKTKGWRVVGREFDLQELQLLIDSIQASRFITQRQAKNLTEKLKAKASRFERKTLDRRSYVANRVRSQNDSVFYYIDNIHIAIADDWQITFRYFYFNPRKEKVYHKKGQSYHASPYALLWNDNNYYLLAYEGGKMKHFRVDKMDTIKISYQKREGKDAFNELKLSERSLRVFSMYSGKTKMVKMRFSNHLAGVVLDRFGQDIMMIPDGEKHFTLTTEIEVSDQFYGWLCGLGGGVRLLAPEEEVDKYQKHLQNILSKYEDMKRE